MCCLVNWLVHTYIDICIYIYIYNYEKYDIGITCSVVNPHSLCNSPWRGVLGGDCGRTTKQMFCSIADDRTQGCGGVMSFVKDDTSKIPESPNLEKQVLGPARKKNGHRMHYLKSGLYLGGTPRDELWYHVGS